jgi:Xaa-Pro aminopeptidase
MANLVEEKTHQAAGILKKEGIDLWLTFVRESTAGGDPILPYIYGNSSLTWQSILLFSSTGERIAIVGRFEGETARQTGGYDQVILYDESIRPHLLEVLERLAPQKIAINTSENDVMADGLSHGLYQLLSRYLEDTPYINRFVSAEKVIGALRGRKIPDEISRIKRAVLSTLSIFAETYPFIQIGRSEREIAHFMQTQVTQSGWGFAWPKSGCPIVNTGPDSPIGHGLPTDLTVQSGHIVHIDFGVCQDEYCSDLQRVAYILRPGETQPPRPVKDGFATVLAAKRAALAEIKPGVTGLSVDAAARAVVTGAGYPEYKHATGHQLGRLAHDGGGILGPAWDRYGDTPNFKLEPGQIYTIEPGVLVPGYGYIGIEEDILVTEGNSKDSNSFEYLGEPQDELVILQ